MLSTIQAPREGEFRWKQRAITWTSDSPAQAITNRGYTGHEQIEEVGLIHMNGRVYDAELGRFLSADPYVQSPYQTNSFNRYSYVWNNPLKYTDPTGFNAFSDWASDTWEKVKEFFSGSGDSSGGNGRDKDNNGDNKDHNTDYKNITQPSTKAKQKKDIISDQEYADFKGGKFVADGKEGNSSSYVVNGSVETLEVDEAVEQDLNVETEKYSQGELMDTEITDMVTTFANELVGLTNYPPAIITAQAMEGAIKSTETVKLVDIQYNSVTYKVMSAPAIKFSNGDVYIKHAPIDTGRRVVHMKVVGKYHREVNVREVNQPQPLNVILRK